MFGRKKVEAPFLTKEEQRKEIREAVRLSVIEILKEPDEPTKADLDDHTIRHMYDFAPEIQVQTIGVMFRKKMHADIREEFGQQLQVDAEVKAQQIFKAYLSGEEFIDTIIERVNRKQIRRDV